MINRLAAAPAAEPARAPGGSAVGAAKIPALEIVPALLAHRAGRPLAVGAKLSLSSLGREYARL